MRAKQAGEGRLGHEPARPSWCCVVCDEEWPCRRRRTMLRTQSQGSRIHLAVLMAGYYHDAIQDRPDLAPVMLHARFLGWLRR
jgi:hypothetical protein